jgi:hypothetical protein
MKPYYKSLFLQPGPIMMHNISYDVIKKRPMALTKKATLEILAECPSYNEKRLPEFYKRMGFPVNRSQ